MIGLQNLQVKTKLGVLVATAILGLSAFAIVSFSILKTVEVDGPLYTDIYNGLSLMSDLVPPVLEMMTPRITVEQALQSTDKEKIAQFSRDFQDYRKSYDESYA